MDANNENTAGPDLGAIKRIIDSIFVDAGFNDLNLKDEAARVRNTYSGKGMVWVMQLLNSFDEFSQLWTSSEMETRLVTALMRVATAEQRWNLTLLVVVADS